MKSVKSTMTVDGVYYEMYSAGGCWHREDGPAYVRWDKDGNKTFESYWINGKKHREDGPAVIGYDSDGNVTDEEYYLDDEEYTKEEFDRKINNNKPLFNLFGE